MREAYLGSGEMRRAPRALPLPANPPRLLAAEALSAGYGAVPVLRRRRLRGARAASWWRMLGANGAGKSTIMRARERAPSARVGLDRARRRAHRDAGGAPHRRAGLVLVPEGRQVFPELSVRDNLCSAPMRARRAMSRAEVAALLERFPRLKRAHRQPGRVALGRRAADAGHRARR